MANLMLKTFTREELDEVFSRPPLREVVFEVRFTPRLRVPAEIWRLQDEIVRDYPEAGKESAFQPNGALLDVSIFQNPALGRVIKVSHQNFLLAFSQYRCFEDFKKEAGEQTSRFCSLFGIDVLTRLGLRYVNEIAVPTAAASSLVRYVRPVIDFDRFPIEEIQQFATELHMRFTDHLATVRSVLLPGVLRSYVLDIDCHVDREQAAADCASWLDQLHDGAQRLFLDHVTDEYKKVMRGAA